MFQAIFYIQKELDMENVQKYIQYGNHIKQET